MEPLHISQLGIYNPGRLTDEQIERLFTARIGLFEHLIKVSTNQKVTSTPQHQLLIGPRGMGKSTLLHRIAAELRKEPYKQSFVPLTFPEEQYNVDRIEKLWLNCLDALADALEREGNMELLDQLDDEIEQHRELGENGNGVDLAELFRDWTKKTGRRPVLLIDNMSLIFSGLDKQGQHALREALMRRGAPILVAASVIRMSETEAYEAPFYDAFQVHTLPKLSFSEAQKIIKNLAQQSDNDEVLSHLKQRPARLRALYDLTGGTPRTLMLLYPMIQAGFSADIRTDLDGLLDIITPLYKARLDELPVQVQVILDAVALHWSPVDLEGLRNTTQLKNHQLSPQLKRLVDSGWLRKLDNVKPGGKGKAYEMNERFFNIWYLMRRSSRRQKRELLSFSKFLETFYGEDLDSAAQYDLAKGVNDRKDAFRHLALSQALENYNPTLAIAMKDGVLKHNLSREWLGDLLDQVTYTPTSTEAATSFFSKIDSLEGNNFLKHVRKFIKEENVDITSIVKESTNYAEKNSNKAEKIIKEVLKIDENLVDGWIALGILYTQHSTRYNEAEIAYRKAISIDPKYTFAWIMLGNLLENSLNQYNEAEIAYRKALDIDPQYLDTWSKLGNLLSKNPNRHEEAEKAYRKALDIDPQYLYAWSNLGDLLSEKLNRHKEAEEAYRKALDIDPEYLFAWVKLGDLLRENINRHKEAEEAYRLALKIDPDNTYALIGLGTLFQFQLNQYDEAEKMYRSALKIQPENSNAWIGLGNLLQYHLNRYDEAEIAYRSALKNNSDSIFAWIGLGELFRVNLNRYDEAELAFHSALKIKPESTYTWNALGNLLRDHPDRSDEAEEAYRTALKFDPDYTPAWYGLGNILQYHSRRSDEAEEAYRTALKFDPEYAPAWYGLGNILQESSGRYEEAESAYHKAVNIYPDYIFAWTMLGNLYRVHLELYDEAEEAYRSALKFDPKYPYAWAGLGKLFHYNLNSSRDAELAYRSALKYDSKNTFAWTELGNLLLAYSDRFDEAENAYRSALKADPTYYAAWNGLGNLLLKRPLKLAEAENAYRQALNLESSPWISFNLIYILRDLKNKYDQAQELYLQYQDHDPILQPESRLNQSLFNFYSKGTSSALTVLPEAISLLDHKGISVQTLDDWQRYAAVFTYYGYANSLLKQLEPTGANTTLRPYVEAISAASSDIERHLLSIPAEMRESTRHIASGIVEFVQLLENTEHLRDPSEKARLMKE